MNKFSVLSLAALMSLGLTACGGSSSGGDDDGGGNDQDIQNPGQGTVEDVDSAGSIGSMNIDDIVLLAPGALYEGSYYHRIYEQVREAGTADMTGDDRMVTGEECSGGGTSQLTESQRLVDPQSPYYGGLFDEVTLFFGNCGKENWGDGYLDGRLRTAYPDPHTESGYFQRSDSYDFVVYEEFGMDLSPKAPQPLLISMPVHLNKDAAELSMFGSVHGEVTGRSSRNGWIDAHGKFRGYLKTSLDAYFGAEKESVQWGTKNEDFSYSFTDQGDTTYYETYSGYYAKEVTRHDDEPVPDTCPQGGLFVMANGSLIVEHSVGDRTDGVVTSGSIIMSAEPIGSSSTGVATVSYDDDMVYVSVNSGETVKSYTRAEVDALRQARCGF